MSKTRKQKRISKMKKPLRTFVRACKLAIARTKDGAGEVIQPNQN
jgi:hypothetical protein